MQDFYRAGQHKDGDTTRSIHLAYPFVLSTRDMARLGYLMLRDGNWNGKQLVPRTWVRLTTRLVTPNADLHPASWSAGARPTGYGWLWWVEERPDTADALHGAYSARGAFGQYIWVIPKLDMVVAHKVVIRRGTPSGTFVSDRDMKRILDALIAAHCSTRCH